MDFLDEFGRVVMIVKQVKSERVQMSEAESCPNGHGKLKRWEGELRCWSCGWPDMKKTNPKESKSFFSGKLFLSLILDAIGNSTYIIPGGAKALI